MKELTTQEAFNKAAACCSGAEYCLSDIQKKLDKWGLGAAQQKEVLTRLQAEKFIDEARFSRCFVRDKFRYNQWGRIKIMQAFRLKNIPDTCCREALTEIEEEEYLCVLRKLLQSKARSVKAASDYERNGKLIRFGLSRGFEMNAITRLKKTTSPAYFGDWFPSRKEFLFSITPHTLLTAAFCSN